MQSKQDPTLYELLGEETGLKKIVASFYRKMNEKPEARGIRTMHPEDLAGSEQKLFEFLSGWSGGPPLFSDKHGHPMLRKRHLPFAIGKSERDQWMLCMVEALEENVPDEEVRAFVLDALMRLADHMRNREET